MTELDLSQPAALDLNLAERLAAMDAAARVYLDTTVPKNTKRAHRGDWAAWTAYCTEWGFPADTMSVGLFVGFARWLMAKHGKAASTTRRRLAGVAAAFRDHGHPVARDVSAAARRAVTAMERAREEMGEDVRRGKAVPFTVPELRAIYRACPDTLAGRRDRAAVLLQFAIAGRRSEIAALRVADVEEAEGGLLVYVRWGKTGRRTVKVLYGQHPESCPVRAWKTWLEASGVADGHAFRRVDRHGNLGGALQPDAVGALVTRAAERAGLPGRTAHGLRSGLVTAARAAGHDAISIAEHGGWGRNSAEMLGYMHLVDGWGEDNALYGLGL